MFKTRRLALDAMLSAMCAVLGYVSLDFGSLKITFESLPILVGALLFGPADGLLIGGVGTLIYQLLRYGIADTTLLWMLPYAACGLAAGWGSRLGGYRLSGWRLTALVTVCELLITALNTVALYVDGHLHGYYTPALILGNLGLRLLLAVAEAAAFASVLPALLQSVRRVLRRQTAGGETL